MGAHPRPIVPASNPRRIVHEPKPSDAIGEPGHIMADARYQALCRDAGGFKRAVLIDGRTAWI